jgi:hypothetical protein
MKHSKDTGWFSHDSNAKDDPKIMILMDQLGIEGYGIFWILIEILRDQPNYRCPLIILPSLAKRYGTSHEKMLAVVQNYGLFLIEDDEFFFSQSLLTRMKALDKKREQARLAGIKSGEKRKTITEGKRTTVERPLNDRSTDVEQVKERIVKETINKEFEVFWDQYHSITRMAKTDKEPAIKYWQALTEDERNKALSIIEKYFNSLKDTKYCKKARTFLSDKTFNDEFIETGNNPNYYKKIL